MTKINFGEGVPRRKKICHKCKFFLVDTDTVEGECTVDENENSAEFCEYYINRKEGR